jgi:peptidoglycan/xylan/chitin deacetylase (PgdA/CDA1 family)
VRLEDDWRTMARPAVALTFDDGYADNLHQALPLLEEAGIPATFFICTGLLGDRAGFWSDQLARLLLGEGARPPQLVLADNRFGGCWPSAAAGQRRVLHDRLHRAMLTLGPERREEWLIQLRRWAGSDGAAPAADRPLTPEELRRLASSPLVTIGAHGVTHTPLAVLSAAAQRDEIDGSRQALAALLGREPTLFAYPFGGKGEFDATTRRLCRESGFRRAVTTFPGQAHRWSDPLRLPRQLVRDWDAAAFAERLREFWS